MCAIGDMGSLCGTWQIKEGAEDTEQIGKRAEESNRLDREHR